MIFRHVVLNVKKIKHPHTGDSLKEVIINAQGQWSLDTNKILMLVTDNGANVLKAIKLVRQEAVIDIENGAFNVDTSSGNESSDEENDDS